MVAKIDNRAMNFNKGGMVYSMPLLNKNRT